MPTADFLQTNCEFYDHPQILWIVNFLLECWSRTNSRSLEVYTDVQCQREDNIEILAIERQYLPDICQICNLQDLTFRSTSLIGSESS